MRIKTTAATMLMMLMATFLHARDLGRYGEHFSIGEMNLLTLIDQRLQTLQKNGELERWQKEAVKQVKKTMARPNGRALKTTTQPETFYYEPRFTLNRDITDHTGKIIYKKGLTLNALDPSTYPKSLQGLNPIPPFFQLNFIFINGDDPLQVTWCQTQIAQYQKARLPFSVILTAGHVFNTVKTLNHSVKFDQGGVLIEQFGIKAVPSIVSLDKTKLKITEIGLYEMKGDTNA